MIFMKVVNLANEHERLQWREKLGEVLSEKTLYVSEVNLQIRFLKKSLISLESSHHTSNCRWWTSMSLYQKCQTHLILSWSLTPVSTTCSPIFSRSDHLKGFFIFSQFCLAGVSQHCQCGQPRGGDQHGEKAPEGHPCHLEEEEKEEPERTIIMKKRRSGE